MTRPTDELAGSHGDASDTRAVAPIESLCERAGWWRLIDVDSWAVCRDPLGPWAVWRRILSDRSRARREPGEYASADQAVAAARRSA